MTALAMTAFARTVARYGQTAQVRYRGAAADLPVRAFLQPLREKQQWQTVPSPLGDVRQERLLYLGDPDVPPEQLAYLRYLGHCYEVQTAQAVYLGGALSHWWAVLTPRDEEAV